jgi:hypothetical protein
VKTTKRPVSRNLASEEAERLTEAVRSLGNYTHVTVQAQRGFLTVHVDDEPVARLARLAPNHYVLSFHHHTGRWEPTPFAGDLSEVAGVLVNEFGAFLDRAFPPTMSGSDH